MKGDDGVPEIASRLALGFRPELEPELGFESIWVQERRNQLVMLDTFFGAIEPQVSLVFFYAKKTPLIFLRQEDPSYRRLTPRHRRDRTGGWSGRRHGIRLRERGQERATLDGVGAQRKPQLGSRLGSLIGTQLRAR